MLIKFNHTGTMAMVNGKTPYYIRDGVVWRGVHHYNGYRRKAYDQHGIMGRHTKCHFRDRDEARQFLEEATEVFNSWRDARLFHAF